MVCVLVRMRQRASKRGALRTVPVSALVNSAIPCSVRKESNVAWSSRSLQWACRSAETDALDLGPRFLAGNV